MSVKGDINKLTNEFKLNILKKCYALLGAIMALNIIYMIICAIIGY